MIDYCPTIVFDKYDFERYLKKNILQFMEDIDSIQKELEKISNYRYHISPRFTNIFGDEFSFGIYQSYYKNKPTDNFSLSVWDYTGGTSIFNANITGENLQNVLNELFILCDKWSVGEMKCADCGKIIKYQENRSHRYFAGVYCENCWETKWKEIESKENYE